MPRAFLWDGQHRKKFSEIRLDSHQYRQRPQVAANDCCGHSRVGLLFCVPTEHFDFIWASPCCTQYSKAKTVGTRDLEGADKLIKKTLEIIKYFNAHWCFENPESGLLKTREIVKGLPFSDTSYCKYGYSYRKKTRLWSSLVLSLREPCSLQNPCTAMVGKRHPMTAQQSRRGSDKNDKGNVCSQKQLYSIPEELCDNIARSADRAVIEIETDESLAGANVPTPAEEV